MPTFPGITPTIFTYSLPSHKGLGMVKMMAKKSEFAQKLLDDLRLRKERIAAGTEQTYTYSKSFSSKVAQDPQSQSNKGHQRNTRVDSTSKKGTYKTNDTYRRSSSFSQRHDSKELSNVSSAIDFVFQNGHKLTIDSSMRIPMLKFLQQVTHGSVTDFQNWKQKDSIKMSKVMQKLTNILTASSDERKPEKYSIEIGKELFQSGKDLLESLRMLVELQEAAEKMSTHQKTRIKLLEKNDEKQKQIDNKPRFSFDKKLEDSFSIRQRSVAVTNVTISATQRRSSSGESKQEKKGLTNIIAKLMGLEEVSVSQHSDSVTEMCRESDTKLDSKVRSNPHSSNTNNLPDRKLMFIGASFDDTGKKKRQSSDSLSSLSCNQAVNKLRNDTKNGTLNIRRPRQHTIIQNENQERRRKLGNNKKVKNSVGRAPISNQKSRMIIPKKDKRKTETEIRNLSRRFTHNQQMTQTGFGLSKRKPLRQGLHKKDKTEDINRKSVTEERASSDISDRLNVTKELETLNEEETKLKCQLILSQHFRNTAETLFNMKISVADNQDIEYTNQGHMVETANEIMKRKSRRKKLKFKSLNDLIKNLYKDFQTLKYYGGVRYDDDIGAYLLKMVERDMYCTEPDINCMWEYGWINDWWFESGEKDETVEELEKWILDDLLYDIMRGMTWCYSGCTD